MLNATSPRGLVVAPALTATERAEIARIACQRAEQQRCFDATVVGIARQRNGAYLVNLQGTVMGQNLVLQALVVDEGQGRYSSGACWIWRHA